MRHPVRQMSTAARTAQQPQITGPPENPPCPMTRLKA